MPVPVAFQWGIRGEYSNSQWSGWYWLRALVYCNWSEIWIVASVFSSVNLIIIDFLKNWAVSWVHFYYLHIGFIYMFFCEVKKTVIGLFSSARRVNIIFFPFSVLLNSINGRRKKMKKTWREKVVLVTLQQSVQKQNSALWHTDIPKPIKLPLLSHRVSIVKSITFSSSAVIRQAAWGLLAPPARVSDPLWKSSANRPWAEQRCCKCTLGCERCPGKPYCYRGRRWPQSLTDKSGTIAHFKFTV